MKLTKADLLNGTQATHDVYIKALDGEVTIRALTDGELSRAEAMAAAGQRARPRFDKANKTQEMDMELDLERSSIAQFESNCFIAAKALTIEGGDSWDPKDVTQLPPGSAEQIAEAAVELTSGPEVVEDATTFREKSSRNADS